MDIEERLTRAIEDYVEKRLKNQKDEQCVVAARLTLKVEIKRLIREVKPK